jgi:predicted dehydrogenase
VASRRDAGAYAEEHAIPRWHRSYEALLEDPEIDLVYNALPPSAHAEWTIAALEAGKDVLCEKPFVMNAGEAGQVVAAAARTGRRVIEAFHDHYHPLQAWIRGFLAGGGIGRVRAVDAVFDGANPFDPASIRHVPELGGGALMDLGCYPVHWVRSLFGEPAVVAAQATRNPLGADFTIRADLRFDGGITGTVAASMEPHVALRSDLEVLGEGGRLTVRNLVFPSRGHSIVVEVDGLASSSTVAGLETYDHQLEAVLAGLASGEQLPTEGEDPVGNMRAIDAIYAAAGVRPS